MNTSDMESMISRQLDGELSPEEQHALEAWIRADPEHARQFAWASLVHSRLRAELQVAHESASDPELPALGYRRAAPTNRWFRWSLGAIMSTAALTLVGLMVMHGVEGRSVIAAETQLEHLIAETEQASDRSYLLSTTSTSRSFRRFRGGQGQRDAGPKRMLDREMPPWKTRQRGRPRPPIEGAMLHLRGKEQFVLQRRFKNGDELIAGSDGEEGWLVPPRGKVRVSSNPNRFRRETPGRKHSIPFIDLRHDLGRLRTAYRIRWLPEDQDRATGERGLVARKRSPEFRGPRSVEIWFEPESGKVTELKMEQMPMGPGQTGNVLLTLIDEEQLPSQFFSHGWHHDDGREVQFESDTTKAEAPAPGPPRGRRTRPAK